MARAGAVWVDVLPNMSRFGRDLDRQIHEPIVAASRRAGEDGGEAASEGLGAKLKAGAAAVGLAAGAALTAGLGQAVDGQKATGQLKAQLGLTAKEAQRAGQAAGKLYSGAVTESVEDGAAAVKAIMSAGIAPEKATTKQLTAIATKVQDVSTLFETDLGQTANAVGQVMKTGLAKNSKEALDTITKGFQVMGPRADDLMDTFNEYSTIFRSLNLPIKTVTGLLSQGMRAGARDTDVVADALKEFQIRATDGSDASADGFKALGLSAKGMTAQIAKGGKGASDGLQTVLDKLRGIKDPVKRNAAAVALFGTKAEDMGKALFALDPSKAVKDLGKVGGAAKQAGDDLRDNAATKIEVFKRQAMMGLANVLTTQVVPAVKDVAPAVKEALGPVRDLWQWLSADPDRMRAAAVALLAVAGAAGALKVASATARGVQLLWGGLRSAGTFAMSAARNVRFAAFAVRYYTVIGVQSAKQAIVTGARWAAAGVRSGAGWVAARARAAASFVATAASATVNAVRTGAVWVASSARAGAGWAAARARAVGAYVATAASATVNAARTGAVWAAAQLRTLASTARATAALVLQRGAMLAAATGARIMAAGQWLLNAAMSANPLGLVIGLLVALGAGMVVAYQKSATFRAIVQGAWSGIKAGAQALVGWATGTLIPFFTKKIPGAIGSLIGWVKSHWPLILSILTGPIGAATIYIIRHWGDIKRGITGAWNAVKSNVLSPMKTFFTSTVPGWGATLRDKLVGAFRTARDSIGRVWAGIKEKTKGPVRFVVDTVYGKGIKKVWDGVAGMVHLPKLPTVKFAEGGRTRGGVPGRDSIPALMMADEFVVKRSSARSVGYGTLDYINRTGQLPIQRFGDGGIVGDVTGWLGDKARKVGGVIMDGIDLFTNPSKLWDKATKGIRNKIAAIGESPWAQAIGKIPLKMLTGLKDKILGAAKGLLGKLTGSGGSGVKRWSGVVLQALRLVGQPSTLLPIVLRRMNQESGGNQYAINKWDINAKRGDPSRGLMQTIGSTFNAYAGKLRSRGIYDPLANIYASMRYALATYGSLSSAYNRPGGYAAGGRPRAGELAWVGERGPELVKFRGGEEVYDHRTSLGMAAGLGMLDGYAKGTSSAKAKARAAARARTKARGELPGDLTGFTRSLTGSASDISKAANALAADLRTAGGAGRKWASSVLATSTKLQGLAKRRDSVQSRIAEAKQAQADQRKAAADYIGLSNVGDVTSIGGLITGLKGRQASAKTFQSQIASLSKKGLSQDLISQLVAMGPDSSLARMVSGASAGQIKQLNALSKSGAKLSSGYGATMADAMFDSGKNASRGFLAGLQSQEKELQAAMDKLGGSLVKAIKKRLKIKSPSRVTTEVGEQVGAGVVVGALSTVGDVERAATELGQAAIPPPGALVPATAGQAPAPEQGTGLDGRPLYLVVEDGTVLRAYVDDRVDGALTDVRRRKRAGAK